MNRAERLETSHRNVKLVNRFGLQIEVFDLNNEVTCSVVDYVFGVVKKQLLVPHRVR